MNDTIQQLQAQIEKLTQQAQAGIQTHYSALLIAVRITLFARVTLRALQFVICCPTQFYYAAIDTTLRVVHAVHAARRARS